MTRVFTWRLRVRTYELDGLGHVNNASYARYLEEAATRASGDAGYDYRWYETHGTVWVVRKLYLRYHAPALYGDELEITTWVADFGRVQSHRDYEIRRVRDGELAVRARANWVYVDRATQRPLRIPEEMRAAFDSANETPDLGTRVPHAERFEGGHRYRHQRRVQRYELDSLGHVNHAMYLNWIEQAVFEACACAGYTPARMREEGFFIVNGAHEIEYFHSAVDGDPVEIISQPVELGGVRGAWEQEVRHAETGDLLARDYNVGVFMNLEGRPIRPDARFIERVLAGPG